VGIAALIAATWIALDSGPSEKEVRARTSLDLHTGAGGTTLTLAGAF
jgi:hypothetical protein